jgi:hypothetical protein
MADDKIKINRAPVMTLWAAIVAERLGQDHEAALTLGRAVAGLNAYSKGKSLGIFDDDEKSLPEESEAKPKPPPEHEEQFKLLGRSVPVQATPQGLRAVANGEPINPASVERYLAGKFRDRLPDTQAAMADLAGSLSPEELARRAYDLYEQFRPEIPAGARGWGAYGELDLGRIRSLARRA